MNDNYNEHFTYEINGDRIYYDPNDPEIIPVPAPEPHHSIQPYPHPHYTPHIHNSTNSPLPFIMNGMGGLYLFLTVTGIVSIGLYISRCIEEHRESVRIVRYDRPRKINIDNLNTILLCNELPDDLCSICLEEFKEGDKIKKLNCNHVYHEECLIPWLNKNDYCPMCRQNII